MREALLSSSNLNPQILGILARVHGELHASFVWLFQRVFSATPMLMVYLMLLLANFTVFSIADGPTVAVSPPPSQSVSISAEESQNPARHFDFSAVRTFSVSRSSAIGGSRGGGGEKAPAVAGADDDCRWDQQRSLSSSLRDGSTNFPEVMSVEAAAEEEARVWKGIVRRWRTCERADGMRRSWIPICCGGFVSPVTVKAEPDDLSAYSETELSYRRALARDPDAPLFLSNFTQLLYVVLQDHDRAEMYFERAMQMEPPDAEALSRYGNFLWAARKELGAAEETFLEVIAVDPGNSYYSANYAHFFWSTGGEDTWYIYGCDALKF